MESNRALVANGWETNVIIQMFPYGPSKNKKKIYIRKKKKDYVYLGNVGNDEGGVNKYVEKYGRKFHNGVYVICSGLNQLIKNCCFVVSLLVALSHLRKDDKYIKMERAPHKPVDDLYDIEEIRNVYQKCGIPPGG